MKILGIDPSTSKLGFAILSCNKNLDLKNLGVLKINSKSLPQKLDEIFSFVSKIIKKFKPDSVAIESAFFSKNVSSTIKISQAIGVIMLSCCKANVPVFSYTPSQIKLSISGNGRASKQQMKRMIESLLNIRIDNSFQDAADAASCALHHYFISKKSLRS